MQGFFPQLLFLMPGIPDQENKQQSFDYKVYTADTALLKSLTFMAQSLNTDVTGEEVGGRRGTHSSTGSHYYYTTLLAHSVPGSHLE